MRWVWVQLKKVLDAAQSWLVVTLVGALLQGVPLPVLVD